MKDGGAGGGSHRTKVGLPTAWLKGNSDDLMTGEWRGSSMARWSSVAKKKRGGVALERRARALVRKGVAQGGGARPSGSGRGCSDRLDVTVHGCCGPRRLH
jgi:hypothetical protein